MRALKEKEAERLDPRASALLHELADECRLVLRFIDRLEARRLTAEQAEEVLGELSAAVLHLHEHTRGLDREIENSRLT